MLVCESDSESKVSFGICAFQLDSRALLLVARQRDIGIKKPDVAYFADWLHVDVYEFDNRQTPESLISTLDIVRRIGFPRLDIAHLVEELRREIAV